MSETAVKWGNTENALGGRTVVILFKLFDRCGTSISQ